jgi:antitoxin component of RelBE/YafQ-DinJ toxin-antitoxin module
VAKHKPQAEEAMEEAKRVQVYIDPDLAKKARVIASALGVSLPDYVNNKLRPIIERELPITLRELGVAVSDGK